MDGVHTIYLSGLMSVLKVEKMKVDIATYSLYKFQIFTMPDACFCLDEKNDFETVCDL